MMTRHSFLALAVFLPLAALLAINPQRDYTLKPDRFGITYTEQRVETADGAQLNTWHMTPAARVEKQDVLFLIASTTDERTTVADSTQFAAARPEREVVTFEGGHLRGAVALGLPAYSGRLLGNLKADATVSVLTTVTDIGDVRHHQYRPSQVHQIVAAYHTCAVGDQT
ncbi:MAG: hypothetical protein WA952_11330 [Lewinella sp.]